MARLEVDKVRKRSIWVDSRLNKVRKCSIWLDSRLN